MSKDMVEKIQWLGHDTFCIQASKTIYIDPWDVSGQPKADIVLVTHEHFDHCSPDDVGQGVQSRHRHPDRTRFGRQAHR